MSDDLYGPWWGVLDTGYVEAKLALHVERSQGGDVVRLHSRSKGELVRPAELTASSLSFSAPEVDIALTLRAEGPQLRGECRHAGAVFPVSLRPGAPVPVRRPRPQTPAPPFPYAVDEIMFEGADGQPRAGALTRPAARRSRGVIVLSPWFGRTDRDQTTAGHKPMAVWADALTRRGFATLRFDKRGLGASGGDFDTASTADFVQDLLCALGWLRGHAGLPGLDIGLMGHSEGGHVSAEAAARDPAVALCILLTPTGARDVDVLESELFRAARAVGATPFLAVEAYVRLVRTQADAVRRAASAEEAVAGVRAILLKAAAEGRFPAELVEDRVRAATSPWRRYWAGYDHVAAVRRLSCPTLAVFAGMDLQTPPDNHLPPIQEAMAGRGDADVLLLPRLNHFLQTAETGAPSEYGRIPETIAPDALEAVCGWIERFL